MLSPVLRKSRHVRLATAAASAVAVSSFCYHNDDDVSSTSDRDAFTTTNSVTTSKQSLMGPLQQFYQQQTAMMMTMNKTDCAAAVATVSSPSRWFGSPIQEDQQLHLPTATTKRRRPSKERLLEETRMKTLKLESRYDVDWNQQPVGEGAFGVVYKGIDRTTGDTVAIKRISKNMLEYPDCEEDFEREMDALLLIRDLGGHKNVCELKENYETDDEFLIVFEYIEGLELFDYLCQKGAFTEKEAARHLSDLVDALKFLHSNGIVHSDLKCENIMMDTTAATNGKQQPVMRVVDFGSAHIIHDDANEDDRRRRVTSRSPSNCPPEALKQLLEDDNKDHTAYVDQTFDQWALGIILYIMLVGAHPYDIDANSTVEEMEQRVVSGWKPPLGKNSPYTSHLSDEAIDLIEGLLERDPKKRLTADEVMDHPWMKKQMKKY